MARKPNSPGGRKPPTSSMSTKNKRHAATIEGDAKDVTPKSTSTSSAGVEIKSSSSTTKTDSSAQSKTEPQKTSSPASQPGKEGVSQSVKSSEVQKDAGVSAENNKPKNGSQKNTSVDTKKTSRQKEEVSRSAIPHAFSHIAAGGIGGGLVLGLAWAFGFISAANQPDQNRIANMNQKLSSLEAAVDAVQSSTVQTALSNKLEDVDKRLANREKQSQIDSQTLSKLKTSTNKIEANNRLGTAILDKLEPRLTRLETTIKSLASAAKEENGSNISKAAGFAVQLNEMEARVSKDLADFKTAYYLSQNRQQQSILPADLKRIADKIARDFQSLQQEGEDASQKINKLEITSGKITRDLDKVRAEAAELNGSISALDKKIGSYNSKVISREDITQVISPVSAKLADIEKSLTAMLKREKLGKEDIERAALAIALSKLQRAIDQGRQFATELDAVKNLAPDELNLETLSSYRNKGIPSLESLSRQFSSTVSTILKADRKSEGQSVLNKFISNARSVVRVRRTGEVKGESAEAILARMEVRVKKGDMSGALTEAEGLTGPALDAAMPWLKQVRARRSVDQAMEKIETELISSISKAAQDIKKADLPKGVNSSNRSGRQ